MREGERARDTDRQTDRHRDRHRHRDRQMERELRGRENLIHSFLIHSFQSTHAEGWETAERNWSFHWAVQRYYRRPSSPNDVPPSSVAESFAEQTAEENGGATGERVIN